MAVVDTASGAAIYFPLFLRTVYDTLVLGFYCSYIWKCPSKKLREFYNSHISSVEKQLSVSTNSKDLVKLLDIGVGTGYFLEHAPLPAGSEVTLVDLNGNCLQTAASRVIKSHPSALVRTVHADFLDPDMGSNSAISPHRLGKARFDVISCFLLLHCLPGPPERKAEAVIRLHRHLNVNGVIVGATVLGKGVTHNFPARAIMFWHNLLGIFDNYPDDVQGLIGPLQAFFETVKWEVVGTTLLFEAKHPKL
ncbi:methyltransferase [Plenodomus tracheiphilus IPT5]|uniref:Methyltransferase n=1 Tax=Plenodomus tracheiphilus IPT5 TaxID=1408161 RepID=A0A6A7AU20_9PLEO|nr:methyltransferase [Plenodomus tracheiphilus IPT5]